MRSPLGIVGFILVLMGISGALDHLWRQPLVGWFLNFFNREIFARVDWLSEHALLANAFVAIVGAAMIVVAERNSRLSRA